MLRTWHPDTRPRDPVPAPGIRWLRLEVLAGTGGSPFHTEGTVAFRAHYAERGREEFLYEHSRFVRHAGAWVYLDASGGD
ncbi:YchJ family metal-binding protein [Streptomyces carminius]|uniref:YchJ family metal-binding protein n=1 Tax=Streptomyces carminius TaxID=2665496 RepID=UPI0038CD8927